MPGTRSLRKYTPAIRTFALLYLALHRDADGMPAYSAAERELAISNSTLMRWWAEEQDGETTFLKGRDEEIERLRGELWASAKRDALVHAYGASQKGLRRLHLEIDTMDARDAHHLAVATSTLGKMSLLLAGDATGRTETHVSGGVVVLPVRDGRVVDAAYEVSDARAPVLPAPETADPSTPRPTPRVVGESPSAPSSAEGDAGASCDSTGVAENP